MTADDQPQPEHDAIAALPDAVQDAGQQAASTLEQAGQVMNDAGEQASETFAATVSDTAKAFEDARGRLNDAARVGFADGQGLFGQFMAGSEALASKLNPNLSQVSQQMATFNAKAIEAWRSNAEATISHWRSLVGVTSWSELIQLNAAHARTQIETMTTQSRELAELASKMTRNASGTES